MTASREPLRPLPWEREGPPIGTGVCFSGGGVRAAAFALGVAQTLQERMQLMFGPGCADTLAAVSGGSYTAAAYLVNAVRGDVAGKDAAPLSDGTPEARHIALHGGYLRGSGWMSTAGLFAGLGAANLAAFLSVFAFAGLMIALYAWLLPVVQWRTLDPFVDATGDRQLLLAAVAAVGCGVLVRGLYLDGGLGRFVRPLAGVGMLLLGGPALMRELNSRPYSSDPAWWWHDRHWLPALAIVAVVLLLTLGLRRLPWTKTVQIAQLGQSLLVWLPRLVGLVALASVSTWMYGLLVSGTSAHAENRATAGSLSLLFGVLLVAWLLGAVAERTSLHGFNRERISRCFSVVRDGQGVTMLPPCEVLLTELKPPAKGDPAGFPRLLICATANVIWRYPGGSRRSFAPFVFSHDMCGVPGLRGANLPTTVLERSRVASSMLHPRRTEPMLPLMSAVACTGAVASPAMGKRTVPALRPLIALLNIRLGRWVHNPMSARIRERACRHGASGMKLPVGIQRGYDEFVPELLGLHRPDAPRLYVSDGGHFDNTGILALLIARCRVIFCVDSQADPTGDANQLREVIRLAEDELGITINMSLDEFKASADGLLPQTHAVGTIDYPDGSGVLVVIKLGLTSSSPQELRDLHASDRAFPHHGTFKKIAYDEKLMDGYRKLGNVNADAALDDPAVTAATPPA